MSSLEIRVCGRYRLDSKLYQGKYSSIYSGKNVQSDTDCCIKCESKNSNKHSFVQNQGRVLEEVQGGVGIPNLLWYGENGDFWFLVTELLGASLEDYFDICGRKFSLKTVLMIADKILSSVEFIHYKQFVHRDITPTNFCVGLGRKLSQIHTIDFSFATPYYDNSTKSHRADHLNVDSFVGTLAFASLNVLKGHRNSRRDDLQSIGLMLIYFLKGGLPWESAEGDTVKKVRKEILRMQESISLDALCEGLPKQFQTYLQYVRSLTYAQEPDYNYLKRIFKQKMIRECYQHDNIFDWILIPLKLKDRDMSNRIPLNRVVKKEIADLARSNADWNFRQDWEFWEGCIKWKKGEKEREGKEKDKDKNTFDMRVGRAISVGGIKPNLNQSTQAASKNANKKGKDDCLIY